VLTAIQKNAIEPDENRSRGSRARNGFIAEDVIPRLKIQSSRTSDRRVQVVLMVLEDNSQRKLVIQDIAEIVNLSPGRLAHLFRDEMGTSVQQYLTQIRLAKAKRQLESGFLSIKEIAAAVGFCNVNQFTNTFKTANGITPTQYRQLPRSILPERKDLAIARSANE
jgi:transcriptional regulator GlxA family with amidase domain